LLAARIKEMTIAARGSAVVVQKIEPGLMSKEGDEIEVEKGWFVREAYARRYLRVTDYC